MYSVTVVEKDGSTNEATFYTLSDAVFAYAAHWEAGANTIEVRNELNGEVVVEYHKGR